MVLKIFPYYLCLKKYKKVCVKNISVKTLVLINIGVKTYRPIFLNFLTKPCGWMNFFKFSSLGFPDPPYFFANWACFSAASQKAINPPRMTIFSTFSDFSRIGRTKDLYQIVISSDSFDDVDFEELLKCQIL